MKTLYTLILSALILTSCGENTSSKTSESTTDKIVPEVEQAATTQISETLPDANQDAEAVMETVNSEANIENTVSKNNTGESVPPPPIQIVVDDQEVVGDDIMAVEEIMPETAILKANHATFDALLKKNVSSSGKVNYKGVKSSMPILEAYIKQLEGLVDQDEWTRNDKLAYWINLYNAATIRLIVSNYPLKSITDLHGGKPWDQKVVKVGSKSYSLNDIENGVIRPRFKEARIHFAVNCAAQSCPKLLNGAFMPDELSSQLRRMTKAFINKSGKNEITADKVIVSKIFDWYKDDFNKGDLIKFLNTYSEVEINPTATIEYKDYDWSLND